MKGFKGFDKNLKCLNKQYKENTVFEEDKAEICNYGMHFCKNPLDVLDYYPLIDNNGDLNQFAEVEALDETFTDDGKKYCTKKLKIGGRLDLKGLIKASFNFLWENVKLDNAENIENKDYSQVATSGYYSQVATSGYYSQVATSGYSSKVATSGYYSQVATSGYYSQVATSGDSSKVATSGDYSQVATSGDYSQVATSGDSSQVATSGDSSQVATSGDSSKVAIKGNNSVGANIGIDGKIKGVKGTWITLAEYVYDEETNEYIPVYVKSAKIDGEILKENTWYTLKNGVFVECED